uniref:(northern house mosquito) hypothetical protein n=1 Tax=Culex pipiens TaxID=7175 RepID=A0A8D8GAV6_CULPI
MFYGLFCLRKHNLSALFPLCFNHLLIIKFQRRKHKIKIFNWERILATIFFTFWFCWAVSLHGSPNCSSLANTNTKCLKKFPFRNSMKHYLFLHSLDASLAR